MTDPDPIIQWLIKGDPAIRWQVKKDLLGVEKSVYEAERLRLAETGWAADLLQRQGPDGLWGNSVYDGKWTSTTYTLYLLKLVGLPPQNEQARQGCARLLESGLYQNREIRFSRGQKQQDVGVTGLVLSICAYFGTGVSALSPVVDHLLALQSPAGNWLPYPEESAESYTFETTLQVLEGLCQYSRRFGVNSGPIWEALTKGQAFLLGHRLYLTDADQPIKPQWTSFSFPPYWFYDVLTVLDHFQAAGVNPDPRLQAGIDLIFKKRSRDGTWSLGKKHPGKTYFEMEVPRSASRWNTLRALRVLKYWETKNKT